MILTCPECATSYFVDDGKIPAAGREVRCAACSTRWTATPSKASDTIELETPLAPAETAPEPDSAIEIDSGLRRRPNREALPTAFRARVQEKKSVKAAAAAGAVWAG